MTSSTRACLTASSVQVFLRGGPSTSGVASLDDGAVEVEVWTRFLVDCPNTPDPLAGFLTSVGTFGLTLLSFTPRAEREELVRDSF